MSCVIHSLSNFSLFIVVFELTDFKKRGRRERGKWKYCGIIYNFIQFVLFFCPFFSPSSISHGENNTAAGSCAEVDL